MARRVARGYVAAERLPEGRELSASSRRWRLATPVGAGGFGDLYSAVELPAPANAPCPLVVKIEPHENGPLFVEMHFYMRNAKKDDVNEFIQRNKLKLLGMPIYIASGSHEYNNKKYRFIVMDRFGTDLWKKFLESDRHFPTHTVFRLALQMLDVYEYIHGRSYVHADLKAANILFGLKKSTENQAYLVDFGLASHYTTKEYKFDPKKAHNGTIEYTSRDAHKGVPTRRGDMEILGYNLVQWLTGSLPWETDLRSPVKVEAQKDKYMNDIPEFMKKCFIKSAAPSAITSYLKYVSEMEYDETPDYDRCRQMFESGLKSLGYGLSCNLDFTPVKTGHKSPKAKIPKRRKTSHSESEDKDTKLIAKKKPTRAAPKTKPNKSINSSSDLNETGDGHYSLVANTPLKNHNGTASSVDIFEDSCETPPMRGVKRKHTKKFAVEYCTDEEVIVHTTVKKKGGVVKEETRSWKKCPTIVNGRMLRSSQPTG